MSLTQVILAVLAAPTAAGGGGPSGDPTSVSLYLYNGNEVGVQWSVGDTSASHEVGKSTTEGVEPTSVTATVASGTTTYETGEETSGLNCGDKSGATWWWVRAKKNGQVGSWVESSDYACGGAA